MTHEEIEAYYDRERANDPYSERHWYKNQFFVVGIPINPVQRYYFDMTPNEERCQAEINDWWDKPYIVTQGFVRDTYKEYVQRMGEDYENLETKEAFTRRKEKEYKQWDECFSDGYRYDVHVLNGGAWDRSLNLGHFDNIEDAIAKAKAYKPREYKIMSIDGEIMTVDGKFFSGVE